MHVGARESSTTSAAHTGHDNPSDSLARSATAPEPELMDSSSSLHWHKEQDREGRLGAGQNIDDHHYQYVLVISKIPEAKMRNHLPHPLNGLTDRSHVLPFSVSVSTPSACSV